MTRFSSGTIDGRLSAPVRYFRFVAIPTGGGCSADPRSRPGVLALACFMSAAAIWQSDKGLLFTTLD